MANFIGFECLGCLLKGEASKSLVVSEVQNIVTLQESVNAIRDSDENIFHCALT